MGDITDALFERMDFDDWEEIVHPPVYPVCPFCRHPLLRGHKCDFSHVEDRIRKRMNHVRNKKV